jgi:hypothetical protein
LPICARAGAVVSPRWRARRKHGASTNWSRPARGPLALIAIELPRWQLRRLAYDDGEWYCALSNQREMPEWLDASVETHHPEMALAILDAFREAISSNSPSHLVAVPPSSSRGTPFEPMLCDNYA